MDLFLDRAAFRLAGGEAAREMAASPAKRSGIADFCPRATRRGEPARQLARWKGGYVSDPFEDVYAGQSSRWPRSKLSDHRSADRGGCRDRTRTRAQYVACSTEDRPCPDLGRRRKGP